MRSTVCVRVQARAGGLVIGTAIACLTCVVAPTAIAESFSDIQFWVGSGTNQAALIVDWNDGKNRQSLMWGYRWDGSATGEEMLHAIVAADSRLFAHVSTTFGGGLGTALYGVGYDLDDDGVFGVSPALTFDAGGYSVGSPGDGRTPTDADDHWQEGWFADGFWSYWVGTPDTWGFSGLGMSSRVLNNGDWDGWSYAPGFDSTPPSTAIPAVPAPASLVAIGLGSLIASRRRRARIAAPIAALAAAGSASADYVYDPTDFAVEVVASTGLSGSRLYNDPQAVLGRPAMWFDNSFTPTPDYRRVKLIEPAFSVGRSREKLITTLNAGQSITVRMGRTVYDDPSNPYGVDLNVFGNAFFVVSSGGFVSDATNLNTTTLSGGMFAEDVRVSVSPDGVDWYTYLGGRTGDSLFPTNSFLWDRAGAAWTDREADPTKPVDPALLGTSFAGRTAADVLDLYAGSAGGVGFDVAESGFSFINYVRLDGVMGFAGGEIDAIAAVRGVPSPGTTAFLSVCGLWADRRRRSR